MWSSKSSYLINCTFRSTQAAKKLHTEEPIVVWLVMGVKLESGMNMKVS